MRSAMPGESRLTPGSSALHGLVNLRRYRLAFYFPRVRNKKHHVRTSKSIYAALLSVAAANAGAAYQADIGYTALQATLGVDTPTGDGVIVTHAEASVVPKTDPQFPAWRPGHFGVYWQDIRLPHQRRQHIRPRNGGRSTVLRELFNCRGHHNHRSVLGRPLAHDRISRSRFRYSSRLESPARHLPKPRRQPQLHRQ